jgi:hypothetical protein
MLKSAVPAPLIAATGVLERAAPRAARARARTVALPAVADPAQEEQLLTVRSGADDQPQRIHTLPRFGRGGWTTSGCCARKGAASRALPRCDSARGSGVVRLRALTPQRRRRERSTSTHRAFATHPRAGRSQILRFLLTVNIDHLLADLARPMRDQMRRLEPRAGPYRAGPDLGRGDRSATP